jgi:hypothetical protein
MLIKLGGNPLSASGLGDIGAATGCSRTQGSGLRRVAPQAESAQVLDTQLRWVVVVAGWIDWAKGDGRVMINLKIDEIVKHLPAN